MIEGAMMHQPETQFRHGQPERATAAFEQLMEEARQRLARRAEGRPEGRRPRDARLPERLGPSGHPIHWYFAGRQARPATLQSMRIKLRTAARMLVASGRRSPGWAQPTTSTAFPGT
jgi:hypothetical protein